MLRPLQQRRVDVLRYIYGYCSLRLRKKKIYIIEGVTGRTIKKKKKRPADNKFVDRYCRRRRDPDGPPGEPSKKRRVPVPSSVCVIIQLIIIL